MTSSYFQAEKKKEKHREKKTIEKKKMQRKEGAYLSFLAFAFGMKCSSSLLSPRSFNVELFTFLKPCVLHILQALCYSSSKALPSSRDGVNMRRGEVGGRGNFWGKKGG
jgi:hypothetical protein